MNKGLNEKKASAKYRKRRSSVLYRITALVVVVLVASGLATFFLVRASESRLIEESKERLVEAEAENFFSSLNYAIQLQLPEFVEAFAETDIQKIAEDLMQKRVSDLQRAVNAAMQEMIDVGFHDLEYILLVLPPSQFMPETVVWGSNDETLVYALEVPDYLIGAIEEGTPYILMEEGIPELGLEGDYLLTISEVPNPLAPSMAFYYVAIKSMQGEIAAIDDFYGSERRRTDLVLLLVVVLSILAVVLITFFALSYLIRKRITQPIDELAATAEEVMRGNLDVEIEVREGEEFEGLKRAFKEMVESFRDYIAKSVGEE